MYYYNPNIYPTFEFLRRYDELERFINEFNEKNNKRIKLFGADYETKEFYEAIRGLEHDGERSMRCYNCYKLRMTVAAKYAKENNFDYFTTTLSISPYKNADWINPMIKKNHINEMLYFDFDVKGYYENNQVYSGGVLLEELTQNLEAKNQPNLYFCGEVCDVDGECGGYNLQWAWTSGHIVGENL